MAPVLATVAGSLVVAAALAIGAPSSAPAAEKPLQALVWEFLDPHGRGVGAAEALTAAGFNVRELSHQTSASSARADLIVLGSFVSEHPDYDKYMATRVKGLWHFLRRGGVVLQMCQADQTEPTPPFLPEGLVAVRGDTDSDRVYVESEGHALVAGLKRAAEGSPRLKLKKHGRGKASWESYEWHEGFHVVLSASQARDRFALLEAEVGKGRLLLSSLHLDTLTDANGKPIGGTTSRAASTRLFANLATYVRGVRDGTAPAVTPTAPHTTDPVLDVAGAQPVGWRLATSDVAVFEREKVTLHGGSRRKSGARPFTLHGHELTDGRQYFPASPLRRDLAAIFAFRLPPSDVATEDVDVTREIRKLVPLHIEGRVRSERVADGKTALVTASYAFASTRKAREEHAYKIVDGTAEVRTLFDRDEGVVRSARVDLRYGLIKMTAPRGTAPTVVEEHFEWTIKEIQRHRYARFQKDVDAAIVSGATWLRKKRTGEGRWKAHKKYDVGTTAFVLLTLLKCDTPRDDPLVTETLDWIFQQNPQKNYERAACLMAIDAAYTPEHEASGARPGEARKVVRDVPPKRLEWCKVVASELETAIAAPGSWGYGSGGTVDSSNTQYAVLGLRSAVHLGIPVTDVTWLGVTQHFEKKREQDGASGSVALVLAGQAIPDESKTTRDAIPVREVAGFGYRNNTAYGSMTCAGIGSLAIARHHLRRVDSPKLTAKVDTHIDSMMLGGWAWLDRYWSVDRSPEKSADDWHLYYLYSLERAGILAGVKRVGGKDWYFDGATELLARQKPEGRWSEGQGEIIDTCFALLFLQRATTPLTGR